jgi:hypothetical protein
MTAKVKSNAPHRLIVEGRDDQWSILALTTRHGWDWNNPAKHLPYIDNAEGVERALEALAITVRTYARVGIVLDADISPMDRWNEVGVRLRPLGFVLPTSPARDGTIVEANGKCVGVWLMPDNQNPGKLEDFLAVLIPPGNRSWPWSEVATRRRRTTTMRSSRLLTSSRHEFTPGSRGSGSPGFHSGPRSLLQRSPTMGRLPPPS